MSVRPANWSLFGVSAARRAEADRDEPAHKPDRPQLQLLKGGAASRRERLLALGPRIRLVATVSAVGAVLFGVVAFHVVLSQGQFTLEKLEARADEQQSQYEKLRLEVARLESPQRITDEAINRLGLVPADKVIPVTPDAADMPKGSVDTSGQATTSTTTDAGRWDEVKPHLSSAAK
jgi:cell division protein FtsL